MVRRSSIATRIRRGPDLGLCSPIERVLDEWAEHDIDNGLFDADAIGTYDHSEGFSSDDYLQSRIERSG